MNRIIVSFCQDYFSSVNICFKLFIRSSKDEGWIYSLSVFTAPNLLIIIFIMFFYSMIIWKVHQRDDLLKNKINSKNKVSKSIYLIIITNILCWIPISILGN